LTKALVNSKTEKALKTIRRTVKAPLRPGRGLFTFVVLEGDLTERGAYF